MNDPADPSPSGSPPARESTPTPNRRTVKRTSVGWVVLAIVVWCVAIAAGPVIYGHRLGWLKMGLLLAAMGIFLGLWGMALWGRAVRDRNARRCESSDASRGEHDEQPPRSRDAR